MIYVDSSVVLAYALGEDRRPDRTFWDQPIISSRLCAYEVYRRLGNLGAGGDRKTLATLILSRFSELELIGPIVDRAAGSFPMGIRTLDALHLASVLFLAEQGLRVTVATYDRRMAEAARALDFEVRVP